MQDLTSQMREISERMISSIWLSICHHLSSSIIPLHSIRGVSERVPYSDHQVLSLRRSTPTLSPMGQPTTSHTIRGKYGTRQKSEEHQILSGGRCSERSSSSMISGTRSDMPRWYDLAIRILHSSKERSRTSISQRQDLPMVTGARS